MSVLRFPRIIYAILLCLACGAYTWGFELGFAVLFYAPLLTNAYIDARTHYLRKFLTHYALCTAVVMRVTWLATQTATLTSMDATAFMAGFALFIILFLSSTVSNGRLLGRGDVRLGAVLLLWHGGSFLAVVFIACLAQGVFAFAVYLLHRIDRNARFAFGPWLVFASLVISVLEFQNS